MVVQIEDALVRRFRSGSNRPEQILIHSRYKDSLANEYMKLGLMEKALNVDRGSILGMKIIWTKHIGEAFAFDD